MSEKRNHKTLLMLEKNQIHKLFQTNIDCMLYITMNRNKSHMCM